MQRIYEHMLNTNYGRMIFNDGHGMTFAILKYKDGNIKTRFTLENT